MGRKERRQRREEQRAYLRALARGCEVIPLPLDPSVYADMPPVAIIPENPHVIREEG